MWLKVAFGEIYSFNSYFAAYIYNMKNELKKKTVGYLFAVAVILLGSNFTYRSDKSPNEKVVRAVFTAYEKKDWNMMTSLFAEGFTFSSPNDDHINLKAFKERCWPNAYKIKKFDVVKVVINGDDAFVITNGWTTAGKSFRNTDYFKLKDGKITSDECFFGPGISYPNNPAK